MNFNILNAFCHSLYDCFKRSKDTLVSSPIDYILHCLKLKTLIPRIACVVQAHHTGIDEFNSKSEIS